MVKFSVPNFSSSNTDTLKFQRARSEHGSSSTSVKAQAKKKKNKKKPKQTITPRTSELQSQGSGTSTTGKVKRGRVQKRLNARTSKEQQNKFTQMREACLDMLDGDTDATIAGAAPSTSSFAPRSTSTFAAPSTSSFAARLQSQLRGGRFRYINEQLYTMDSASAEDLFRNDSDAFSAYHVGYKQQVEKWPLNPLTRIIKMLTQLPSSLEIGDFGCGEGKLAESVPHKVFSIDLVSSRDDIIACDMANTPLPSESLDVAVYCLSLMGTNLKDYFLEANRVLKTNGFVYIAEIRSRFDNIKAFIRGVGACGFDLVKKDLSVDLFCFFQFKKVRNVGRVALVPPFTLKPCLYRKR